MASLAHTPVAWHGDASHPCASSSHPCGLCMADLSTACCGLGLAFEVTHLQFHANFLPVLRKAGLGSESWRVSQPPRSHPNNTQTPQESGEVKVRTTKRIVLRAEVGNQRLVRSGQKWTEALLQQNEFMTPSVDRCVL